MANYPARIPFVEPFRHPSGRLVAATFSSPSRPALRVISVYGFSNPALHKQEATALAQALAFQLSEAARQHLTPVILGDLNEHPWSDSSFPRPSHSPHPADWSLHRILTGGFNDKGLPALPPDRSPFFDSFRHAHPSLDGFTLPSKLSSSRSKPSFTRPSRVDQIWLPRSWRSSTQLSSSVDTDESYLSFSDHRLLITSVPFPTAFGCRSHVVRTASKRILTSKYDTTHLASPDGLRDFQRSLSNQMPPILSSLVDLPADPPTNPSSTLGAILAKLHEAIAFSVVNTSRKAQTPRHSFKVKPKSRKPTATDTLLHLAGRVSGLLPSLSVLTAPLILPIWHNFLAAAADADCDILSAAPLSPPNTNSNRTLSSWAVAVLPTTAQAKSFCYSQSKSARSSRFAQAKADLNALYTASLNNSGRLSPFLKRALYPIHRILQHAQVTTETGGASTNPKIILANIASHIYEWHRPRRLHPPLPESVPDIHIRIAYDTISALYLQRPRDILRFK